MTTDGAPGDGPVEPRTIPMPRTAPDDARDDDTQQLPPVRDDADGLPGLAAGAEIPDVVAADGDEAPPEDAAGAGGSGDAADVDSSDDAADVEASDNGADADVLDDALDADGSDEAAGGVAGLPQDAPPPRRPFLPSAPLSPEVGADVPRVYVDGSALSRYLAGAPAREAWLAWAGEHESELVTTALGLSELRRIAQPRGMDARGTAVDVSGRIEVARFSDQTLRKASKVSAVLPPFVALHLGAALAQPGVTAIATYDRQLAQVAALYGLSVVSPGWPDRWWERDA